MLEGLLFGGQTIRWTLLFGLLSLDLMDNSLVIFNLLVFQGNYQLNPFPN